MQYFGPSSSGSKNNGTPSLGGNPLSISNQARSVANTYFYNGIFVQEVRNPALKYRTQASLAEKQKVLLDNFWNIRTNTESMRKGHEKLIRALEQEFVAYNYDYRIAKQQLALLQEKYLEQKKEYDCIVKHYRVLNIRCQNLQEANKPTIMEHNLKEKEANKPNILEHNSEFSLEQKSKNPYFLQTLARERYKFLPVDVKSHIIELEYEQNTSLQLYIQSFLFNLKSNPHPGITKNCSHYTIYLARINMIEYRELHLEHKHKIIIVTPAFLAKFGYLDQLYVESSKHLDSFPKKFREIISFYLPLWKNVKLDFTSIPP